MRTALLGILAFFLFAINVAAQAPAAAAEDATKTVKAANKAFGAFGADQVKNATKLEEAKTLIDGVMSNDAVKGLASTWLLRGKIYNEFFTRDNLKRVVEPNAKSTAPADAAYQSYQAYSKAQTLATKGFEKKDALKGMIATIGNLSSQGIVNYEASDFKAAYNNFNAILAVHELAKAGGEKSPLDKVEDYNNQLYITGLAATNGKMYAEGKPLLEKLVGMKYDKAAVYQALYKIKAETNDPTAYETLAEARKMYPNEVSLLFDEINHFLKLNKMDELIDRLKTAIAKEPKNITLYTTLGSVYENLAGKEDATKKPNKADEYSKNAMDYYNQALAMDATNFDANYSIGAFHYNRAAVLTKELNKLADDYTKAGTVKYDAKKVEVAAAFDAAMPFFKKAEGKNPNDKNTLIALKEIFAKRSDFKTSGELKARLENVEAGKKNTDSYFKN
jgi:hypothetical protein